MIRTRKRGSGSILPRTSALAVALALCGGPINGTAQGLERIRYNQPGLTVELGVGLCSLPMPVDYNNDGLIDLLVTAGQDVPDGYTYYFENTGKREDGIDVFKPGVRIGPKHEFFTPSYVDGELRVLAYNREYDTRDFETSWEIYPEANVHTSSGRIRANQWSYVDFDGNGVLDLIVGVGDWADYGWDDAFNDQGEWVAGPLRGYVYLIRNMGTNEKPVYEAPVKIETTEGVPVEVYGRPSPNFADFTGDGKLDLICGEFLDGLTFFRNVGTRTEPQYGPGIRLKDASGEPIRLKGCMIRPTAYDWTGDGNIDLVVGAEDGSVGLVRHTGKLDAEGTPIFEQPVYFKQQANEVKGGVLITPVSFDWNGDGRDDLIAGNAAGHILYFENLGGNPPKWAAAKKLEADGEVIRIQAGVNGSIQGPAEAKWGYTVVSAADWNHDGLPDLLVNSIWGNVVWYENVGTRTAPKLAAPKPVEVEWDAAAPNPHWHWWKAEGKELVTQWRSTVQVIDLNEDGLNDLVALDQEGYLVFFERKEVAGERKLMPPQRIFSVEPDAPSAFDHAHREVAFPREDGSNDLAGPDGEGRMPYLGREWSGRRWGPWKVFKRAPLLFPWETAENGQDYPPLRMNAGWAGRSGRRKFILTDWTGDGRLDLLVNSSNVNLLENVAAEPGKFIFRNRGPVDTLRLAGHTSSPTVVNWSGGAVPDLLVGAEDGYLYYVKNPYSLPVDAVFRTPSFTVEARRGEIGILEDERQAFVNRAYVWQGVPKQFKGWTIWRTYGGERSVVRLTAMRDDVVYMATAPRQPGISLTGWTEVPDTAFAYSTPNGTEMRVYSRPVRKNEMIDVPQGNWAGGVLLFPEADLE